MHARALVRILSLFARDARLPTGKLKTCLVVVYNVSFRLHKCFLIRTYVTRLREVLDTRSTHTRTFSSNKRDSSIIENNTGSIKSHVPESGEFRGFDSRSRDIFRKDFFYS